jgi:hypothetical protein
VKDYANVARQAADQIFVRCQRFRSRSTRQGHRRRDLNIPGKRVPNAGESKRRAERAQPSTSEA